MDMIGSAASRLLPTSPWAGTGGLSVNAADLWEAAGDALDSVLYIGSEWFYALPDAVQNLLTISFFLAALVLAAALGTAIYENRSSRVFDADSGRYTAFEFGSGQRQRSLVYWQALRRLVNPHWTMVSAVTAAYTLGGLSMESRFLSFFLSVVYLIILPPAVLEMFFRLSAGTVSLTLLNLAYMLFLAVLHLAGLVLRALLRLVDFAGRNRQHCTLCYASFSLPVFQCPHCGEKFGDLLPNQQGLLFTRCQCGKLLPCSLLSGRGKLDAFCPVCAEPYQLGNARHTTLLLVGGKGAGSSSYLAAFQHLYRDSAQKYMLMWNITGVPAQASHELEQAFQNGSALPSSSQSITACSLLHIRRKRPKYHLGVFEVDSHALRSGNYDKNPLVFGYADGILLLIDPLSLRAVRKEAGFGADGAAPVSETYTEELIVDFINQYSKVSGRATRKIHPVPVAVVIGKADITAVKREIGYPRLTSRAKKEGADLASVRNRLCREYLASRGLSGALANLESAFSTVQYFPASPVGHGQDVQGNFQPWGVLEPAEWLVRSSGSVLRKFFGPEKKSAK